VTAAAVLGPRQAGIWRLAGEPSSVAIFRRIARAAARSEAQAEAAALCVSELVTNAIVHTRSGLPGGTVAVWLTADESTGELHILVEDSGARVMPPAGPGQCGPAEHGYGLRIVARVAASWGSSARADGPGSVTWCHIPAAVSR